MPMHAAVVQKIWCEKRQVQAGQTSAHHNHSHWLAKDTLAREAGWTQVQTSFLFMDADSSTPLCLEHSRPGCQQYRYIISECQVNNGESN